VFEKPSAEESKLLTRVMTLGAATALPIVMSTCELARLIGVIYFDTNLSAKLELAKPGIWSKINPGRDYYSTPSTWFQEEFSLLPIEHFELMRLGHEQIPDFNTYLGCLSALHKRRRKYAMILSAQPIPTMIQVSPRSLIEYGEMETEALASWLTWRKFFYDLDNRSAQETGYLFEPILAAAIGGEPKGAKSKVVTRTEDNTKGRQVDCWKVTPEGKRLAYEFKLRVTIAASGQGRFGEEIQFAQDCKNSGAIPILLVLDPTPNARLDDLAAAFRDAGGLAYIGDSAWAHLESEAGTTMARFIERYVRRPIVDVSLHEGDAAKRKVRNSKALLDFTAKIEDDDVSLTFGGHVKRIKRREDPKLSDDLSKGNEIQSND
jgi:hypothetical protein